MTAITEVVITPQQVDTGTQVLIQVKAVSQMTWGELVRAKWQAVKAYTWRQLKGE